MTLAHVVPRVGQHPELRSYRCAACGDAITRTIDPPGMLPWNGIERRQATSVASSGVVITIVQTPQFAMAAQRRAALDLSVGKLEVPSPSSARDERPRAEANQRMRSMAWMCALCTRMVMSTARS